MYFELLSTLLGGIFVLTYLLPIIVNYQEARRTGFFVLISPVNPHSPVWMVLGDILGKSLSRLLPDSLWIRFRYTLHGGAFLDRDRRLDAPSGAIMLVSSGTTQLWIEDAELAQIIVSRRPGIDQAHMTQQLIGIMGPNVFTTNGIDWQRHRRIVTAALGVRIAKMAWSESAKQAELVSRKWSEVSDGVTDDTVSGLRTIAMNVLATAGYGYVFSAGGMNGGAKETSQYSDYQLSYPDVLSALTEGFILIAMLPARMLNSSMMPQAVRKIATANKEFHLYTKQFLQEEIKTQTLGTEQTKTFLSSLVALGANEDPSKKQNLSEDEIRGDLFAFTLAGFDTTANTLAYAVALLSVHSKWQDWVVEEIEDIAAEDTEASYESVAPKLKRCLALMHETLRLYTPVENISRTASKAQSITTSSGSYTIPANTNVFVSLGHIHTKHPYWGNDAFTFRPDRWIKEGASASTRTLLDAPPGAFMPWSAEARVCPGMKMAQAEFLATIFTIFKGFSVRPAILKGETAAMAATRTLGVIRDSIPRLTLQMNCPRDIKLVWQKRPG